MKDRFWRYFTNGVLAFTLSACAGTCSKAEPQYVAATDGDRFPKSESVPEAQNTPTLSAESTPTSTATGELVTDTNSYAGNPLYEENPRTHAWFEHTPDPYKNGHECYVLNQYVAPNPPGDPYGNLQTEYGAVSMFGDNWEYRDPDGAINVVVYDANGIVITSHTTDTQIDQSLARSLRPGTLICENGKVTVYTPPTPEPGK